MKNRARAALAALVLAIALGASASPASAWTGNCPDSSYATVLWQYTGITSAMLSTCNMIRSHTAQIFTNGGQRWEVTIQNGGNSVARIL